MPDTSDSELGGWYGQGSVLQLFPPLALLLLTTSPLTELSPPIRAAGIRALPDLLAFPDLVFPFRHNTIQAWCQQLRIEVQYKDGARHPLAYSPSLCMASHLPVEEDLSRVRDLPTSAVPQQPAISK